jgi:inositol transport system substrate-binding protein
MRKGIAKVILIGLMATALFAGCAKKADGGKTKIGYVSCNFNDTRQVYVMNEFKAFYSDKPEFEVVLQDAQEDVIRQQDLVNTLISQGVNILVVIPTNTDAMAPIIAAAKNKNIPLLFANRNPFNDSLPPDDVYYLGSQPIISGRLQAELAGKLLNGQGNVCILTGILGQEAQIERTKGNREVLQQNFPNIKIIGQDTGNWQRDQGMTITENWLTAHGKGLNAILANNDEMALGAIEALRAAGRSDVIVMGIDGVPDALEAVKNETMAATVFLSAELEGRGIAEISYRLAKGESVEKTTWVPDVFITSDNVDEYR